MIKVFRNNKNLSFAFDFSQHDTHPRSGTLSVVFVRQSETVRKKIQALPRRKQSCNKTTGVFYELSFFPDKSWRVELDCVFFLFISYH